MFKFLAQARIAFAASLIILGCVGNANAGFVGNTVTFDLLYPGANGSNYGSASGVISNGTTLGPVYGAYDGKAVFADTSIRFGHDPNSCCQWVTGVFYRISGAGLGITGVTIADNTNQPELTAGDITFDANTIWIDVSDFIIDSTRYFDLNVSFGNEVPEPASMFLIASALLGLGLTRKRRSI